MNRINASFVRCILRTRDAFLLEKTQDTESKGSRSQGLWFIFF